MARCAFDSYKELLRKHEQWASPAESLLSLAAYMVASRSDDMTPVGEACNATVRLLSLVNEGILRPAPLPGNRQDGVQWPLWLAALDKVRLQPAQDVGMLNYMHDCMAKDPQHTTARASRGAV